MAKEGSGENVCIFDINGHRNSKTLACSIVSYRIRLHGTKFVQTFCLEIENFDG